MVSSRNHYIGTRYGCRDGWNLVVGLVHPFCKKSRPQADMSLKPAPQLCSSGAGFRPSAHVESQRNIQLLDRTVDGFDRLDAMAAKIMIGMLEVIPCQAQRVQCAPNVRMPLSALCRGGDSARSHA